MDHETMGAMGWTMGAMGLTGIPAIVVLPLAAAALVKSLRS